MKYRKLNPEEIIAAGDSYSSRDEFALTQNVSNLSPCGQSFVGQRAGLWMHNTSAWYRPIQESNWISFKDRQPTREDASPDGQIVVLYAKSQGAVTYTKSFGEHYSYSLATHWMPLAFHEEAPALVKVGGRTLTPRKNGDVKISCGTVVHSKDIEELFRQREEVMKS